jgi:hypothetical protein
MKNYQSLIASNRTVPSRTVPFRSNASVDLQQVWGNVEGQRADGSRGTDDHKQPRSLHRAHYQASRLAGTLTHHQGIKDIHLRQLFADDPERGRHLTLEAAGLYLDYSKNRVTAETLRLLVNLASECRLQERIEAMFHGDKINATEKRAVLHVALRAVRDASILVDGENVVPWVHEVLDRMTAFAEEIRLGQ